MDGWSATQNNLSHIPSVSSMDGVCMDGVVVCFPGGSGQLSDSESL